MKIPPLNLPQGMDHLIVVAWLLVGVVQCFLGYRIFKFLLGLVGFAVCGWLAISASHQITHDQALSLLLGIVGGCIGAMLMIATYFLGIFLYGTLFGYLAAQAAFTAANADPVPVVLLVSAVIGGVLFLIINKFMIIVSTSFGGAFMALSGVAMLVPPLNHALQTSFRQGGVYLFAAILCWTAIGVTGMAVQYRWAAHLQGHSREKRLKDMR